MKHLRLEAVNFRPPTHQQTISNIKNRLITYRPSEFSEKQQIINVPNYKLPERPTFQRFLQLNQIIAPRPTASHSLDSKFRFAANNSLYKNEMGKPQIKFNSKIKSQPPQNIQLSNQIWHPPSSKTTNFGVCSLIALNNTANTQSINLRR